MNRRATNTAQVRALRESRTSRPSVRYALLLGKRPTILDPDEFDTIPDGPVPEPEQ